MHKKVAKPPIKFMDKAVPKNKNFSHIPAKLNTGLTVDKVKFVTAQEFAKRRNENFFRLSRGQLLELYNEYELSDENLGDSRGYNDNGSPGNIVTHSDYADIVNDKPYLILDCREPEDYCECHLLHAKSFPFTMQRQDKLLPEYYSFKNKPETLIIIYCDDERMSRDAAKLFVDRGADNIFLLTGGLIEFAVEYPSFVEGKIPAAALPKKVMSTARRTGLTRIIEDNTYNELDNTSNCPSKHSQGNLTHRNTQSNAHLNTQSKLTQSRLSAIPHGPPLTSGGYNSTHQSNTNRIRRDDRSESGYSMNSNVSVAESIISRSIARKGKF